MKKSKSLLIVAVMLAVITVTAVTPTFSWLSSETEPVINTFAGGAIALKLDEAPVDANGQKLDGARVQANTYKYTAGAELWKDPTPTVLKGSDRCYVFLYVENELNDLFAINYDTQNWLKVAEKGNGAVYAYFTRVDTSASNEDQVLAPIFTTVTVSDELTAQDVEELGTKQLNVTAYAVQAASLDSADAIELAAANFEVGDGEVDTGVVIA